MYTLHIYIYIYTFHAYFARARTYTYMRNGDYELRDVRAYEGSSNEKPHYFLMHLLIDQSRKGNTPPTLRPPLPSVNHSRNNLMIGAPVLLSRLPRYSLSTVRVGDYYDAALREIFFLFSRPASPFMLPRYAWTTKKETDTYVRYAHTREGSIFASTQEYTRLSRDRANTSTPGYEERFARTRSREKLVYDRTAERTRKESCFLPVHHFIRMPGRRDEYRAESVQDRRIHEVNRKQPRVLTFSVEKRSS